MNALSASFIAISIARRIVSLGNTVHFSHSFRPSTASGRAQRTRQSPQQSDICGRTKRLTLSRQSHREATWLAFRPDQDYRVMDEAENGALLETRSAKRPRSDDLEAQPVNGAPQHAAVIPAGKAPAVHTKALRSVLKGSAQDPPQLFTFIHTSGRNPSLAAT